MVENERSAEALSREAVDIDHRNPKGLATLMFAAGYRHSRVVRILLTEGANVAIPDPLSKGAACFTSKGRK